MSQIHLQMCYTCLNYSKQLVELQQFDVDNVSYLTKLSRLSASELITQESMAICIPCVKNLRTAYSFQETLAYSQAKYLEQSVSKAEEGDNDTADEEIDDALGHFNSYIEINTDQIQTETNKQLLDKNISFPSQDYLIECDDQNYYVSESKDIKREENVCCERCKQYFDSELELSSHDCFREVIEWSKDIKCEILDRSVKESDSTKIGKPKVSYQCGFCNTIIDKRCQMLKHISRLHKTQIKLTCVHCGRGFNHSYRLKKHLTLHTCERNFSCSFCDKRFRCLSSIKRHMKSHEAPPGQKTKRTPFLCTVCGKSFPFSNGVQRHLRTHLGIRRHECNICHRKFTQSTHLHVHMRTHTGERPYICDFCGETFSLNATLQKHISNLHVSEEVYPLNIYTN